MLIDHDIIAASKENLGDTFDTIVQFFFEDAVGYLAEIETGLQEKNMKTIVRPSHTLKSSSMIIGAILVSKISADIEEIASTESNDGKFQEVAHLFTALQVAINDTKQQLL